MSDSGERPDDRRDGRRASKGQWARRYASDLGWHVYPVYGVRDGECGCGKPDCEKPGKHPNTRLIGHRPKGEGGMRAATTDATQIDAWWTRQPDANIGIRTGRESGIIVLDVDTIAAREDMRKRGVGETLIARSGRKTGGWHVYLRYPSDLGLDRVPSTTQFLPDVDLRADGGSAIAPPSMHASGSEYTWNRTPRGETGKLVLADCPDWLKELFLERYGEKGRTSGQSGTKERGRTPTDLVLDPTANPDWLTTLVDSDARFRTTWLGKRGELPSLSEHRLSIAHQLVRSGRSDQDVLDALAAFDRTHGRELEPLATYANEIAKARSPMPGRGTGKRGQGSSQTDGLLALLRSRALGYGRDQHGHSYVRLADGSGGEDILDLDGGRLNGRLASLYRAETGEVVSPQTIANVLHSFREDCLTGEELVTAVRMVADAAAVYIDHECRGNGCLVIRGGRVSHGVRPSGVVFRRPLHLRPYGCIDPSGDRDDVLGLLRLINAPSDEASRALLLVWLVAAFVPQFPHPLLVIRGPQGSTKTTVSRNIRSLVDPASYGTLAPTTEEKDLAIHFSDNCLVAYDNVSNLNPIADLLCRAITGETSVRRSLYTDREPITFAYQRLVIVNGIDVPITQPDLLDRTLSISLDAIPPASRRLEDEVAADFAAARPRIIGGCLNLVARALESPSTRPAELPRLADWAALGVTIADLLGIGSQAFLDAYQQNVAAMREHAIEGNLFVSVVRQLVREQADPHWTISPAELLRVAEERAIDNGVHPSRDQTWPKSPSWATRRLKESEVDLKEFGIEFEDRVSMSEQRRGIRFRYAAPEQDDTDAQHAAGE